MECPKCNKEVSSDSNFCSNCGNKIEDDSILAIANRGIDSTRKTWFVVGFLRAHGMEKGKKTKWLKEFENMMKKEIPSFYEEYESTIKYWREVVKKSK